MKNHKSKDQLENICVMCGGTEQVFTVELLHKNINILACQTCFDALKIKFNPHTYCFHVDIDHKNCASPCFISNITTSILYDKEMYEQKDFDQLIIPMLIKILDTLGKKFNKRLKELTFRDSV